ncbi:hypothetical protein ACSS6W_003222 [Trichoderma asperelloides]|uniref:SET domain-containing protein 5 n=1 Tax=Trichoderma asperellum TaxID=101201 RepID=A0A6V8QJP0_TRIAP|nr:SET domain-containing protein 5 [Trichoderma asperellum]
MQEAPINDEAGNGNLYTIQPIPGKGRGLIAISNIPKGTRILSELPLFRISYTESNRQVLTGHIAKALKYLDDTKQRAFLDLQNVYGIGDGPFLGIARSNVMPLGPEAPEGGLFLDASRINHSCRPNGQKTWNANIGSLTVHAVRDIEQGEEITISYLDIAMDLCSAPHLQRWKSDHRIQTVAQLERWLVFYFSNFNTIDYEGGLLLALSIFKELKVEGACDARFPSVYHTAFKMAVKNGDTTRAKIFAERAYAARVLVEGDDSPEAVRLAQFVQQPTLHLLYRPSADATEVRLPRDMSESKFEAWLWKQRPDPSEDEDSDELDELDEFDEFPSEFESEDEYDDDL